MRLAVIASWAYEMAPWPFWASIWQSDIRKEKDVVFIRHASRHQCMGGNRAIQEALDMGCDEILNLDVDQDVPADILKRLRAHNKDIVSTLTPLRHFPHVWSMFDFHPTESVKRRNIKPLKPLQKVEVVGMGGILVKADVFRNIEKPWMDNEFHPTGLEFISSCDFYFFKKVKAAGYEVWVDTTLESTHYTTLALNNQSLERHMPWSMHRNEVQAYREKIAREMDHVPA